jgi:tripartite-type tricarboxylate transporter receptor subunit TctC
VHVSFKGSPEALREVIAERIDFYFCPLSTAFRLIRECRVRALAVNTATGANAYVLSRKHVWSGRSGAATRP